MRKFNDKLLTIVNRHRCYSCVNQNQKASLWPVVTNGKLGTWKQISTSAYDTSKVIKSPDPRSSQYKEQL